MERRIRSRLKHLLRGLSYLLSLVGGFSFLFGGGLIRAVGNVDRLFAEILGIGLAVVCFIGAMVSKHAIDDIEWQEANEEADASREI